MGDRSQWLMRVDLTTLKAERIEIDEEKKRYIGGRGMGIALLLDEITPQTDPLSPENPLIFGTGPLSGTAAPSSGRLTLVTKNAVNNGICFSNGGGHFAPELKHAGIDHLMVVGKAKTPTLLFIKDGTVEFLSAEKLWGLDTWETDSAVKKQLEDDRIQILSIGQGGETRSLLACIMINNGRALGFGGCGAIMGAKNLKAIAVRGHGDLRAADEKRFMAKVFDAFKKMDRSIGTGILREGGTINKIGPTFPLPMRNYQDEYWENGKHVTEVSFRDVGTVSRRACFNCPMYCSHFYQVNKGEYAGLKCEGTQINVVRGFGSLLDVPNPAFILKAGSLANRYGLHVDELAATLAWAAECHEKGLVSSSEIGGPLAWGDEKAFLTLIERIAYRKGFGDTLADGVYRASQHVGKGSEKYAMCIKKTGINEGGVRGKKAWALGIATNTRGGGHLSGSPNSEGFRSNTTSIGEARYGVPEAGQSTTYKGKPKLVYWFERFKAMIDSLGMCYFTSYWQNNILGPEDFVELLSAFTGVELSVEEFFRIGDDILNLERKFNYENAGFSRKDDRFPERFEKEPVISGPFTGEVLDRQKWQLMLDEYYRLHGWTNEGIPQTTGSAL